MERGPGLLDYWMDIYAHRVPVALVAVSSAILASVFSLLLPPLYEARSIFYVPSTLNPTAFTSEQALDRLAQHPALPIPEEKAASVNIGILKAGDLFRRLAAEFPGRDVRSLQKNVDVKLGSQFLIEVYVRDRDPAAAAAMANRVPELYLRFHEEVIRKRMTGVQQALERQRLEVGKRIEQARLELAKFQDETGILSPEIAGTRLADLIEQLETDLERVRTQLAASVNRVGTLEEELGKERKLYKEGELIFTNPRIESLVGELRSVEAEWSAMDPGVYHPQKKSLEAKIATLKKSLAEETRRLSASQTKAPDSIYERLRSDLIEASVEARSSEERVASLDSSLGVARGRRDRLARDATHVEILGGNIRHLEALAHRIDDNTLEAMMQASNPPVDVIVVETAHAPTRPVFPLPVLNAVVASVVGIVAGFYYALLLGSLARMRRKRIRRNLDWAPLQGAEPAFSHSWHALTGKAQGTS